MYTLGCRARLLAATRNACLLQHNNYIYARFLLLFTFPIKTSFVKIVCYTGCVIKAVIFDLGGVILRHEADLMPKILQQMFPEDFKIAEAWWQEYAPLLLTGRTSSKEVLYILQQKLETPYTLLQLLARWSEFYRQETKNIDFDVLDLVKKLKKTYKVYLLTDTFDAHDEVNMEQQVYVEFDYVFKSYKMGIGKFEGDMIYREVLQKIQCLPAECIVIDDKEQNIRSAAGLGMHGVIYKNLPDLKSHLHDLGI